MTSTLSKGTLGYVASLLVATLYQRNPDRNHKLWNIVSRWFSPVTPVSSTNKNDRHDITEILLEVVLKTISPPTGIFLLAIVVSVLRITASDYLPLVSSNFS
jgi:hypothetical protein